MIRIPFGYIAILFLYFQMTVAQAIPAGILVNSVTPTDTGGVAGTLLVARTADNDPRDPPNFQLKADVVFANTSGTSQTVSSIAISYPGSGIPNTTYTPQTYSTDGMGNPVANPLVVMALQNTLVPVFDGLPGFNGGTRDLATPLPATVQIQIFFGVDPAPVILNYDLEFHDTSVPLQSYFFPAMASDLPAGQYWIWRTRHVIDSGGATAGNTNPTAGSQRYALDMGVARWTGSGWSELVDGAAGMIADRNNDDYLVWNMPIYAVADGTIVSCYRGEPDHDPDIFANVTWENGGGNALTIRHGDELVSYFHNKENSIPFALCPADGQNNNLSIPVEAGQFLARIGNTGRSTNAHIHIQAVNALNPDTLGGLPMNFLNLRTLADESSPSNLGETPALQPLRGMTLHGQSLVLPNPCQIDFPPAGLAEVSRHGIEAACYQDVFNQIVSRGYRPVFVDGYNVDGNTFFNATFRSGGPAWASRHGLDGTEYQDFFDEMAGQGFRLQQIDSYLQNGQIRYAAIFENRLGPAFSGFHGLSEMEYENEVDTLAGGGFVPINVSTVEIGGQTFWTGLFEQLSVTGWTVETVTAADYQDTFDANDADRRVLIYVHGFSLGGSPYLTGIWVDPIGPSTAAVHGLSSADYQTEFDNNLAAGRLTRYTTGYDDGAGNARFAAIWRARPNTSITSTPPAATNITTAEFEFTSNVPFAHFRCSHNGGLFYACSSPETLVNLAEGVHNFQVYSLDRESVRDLTPASYNWIVDVTPPVITLLTPQPGTKYQHGNLVEENRETTQIVGYGPVAAMITDNLSGVDTVVFSVNGAPVPGGEVDFDNATQTWSFEFKPHLNGKQLYTIEIMATDVAGNSASESFQVEGVKTNKKK